jgi:type VI protein secretion system component VasK
LTSAGVAAIVIALMASAAVFVWLVLATFSRMRVVLQEATTQVDRLEPVAAQLQRDLAVLDHERARLQRDLDQLAQQRQQRRWRRRPGW